MLHIMDELRDMADFSVEVFFVQKDCIENTICEYLQDKFPGKVNSVSLEEIFDCGEHIYQLLLFFCNVDVPEDCAKLNGVIRSELRSVLTSVFGFEVTAVKISGSNLVQVWV